MAELDDTVREVLEDLPRGSSYDTVEYAIRDFSSKEIAVTNAYNRITGRGVGYEVEYVQIIAPVAVTGTNSATANTIISTNPTVFTGEQLLITFFAPEVVCGTGAGASVTFCLFGNDTDHGIIGRVEGSTVCAPVFLLHRRAPISDGLTYHIKAFREVADGTVQAGEAGGAGQYLPAFLRIEVCR